MRSPQERAKEFSTLTKHNYLIYGGEVSISEGSLSMRKKWISGCGILALGGAAALATPSYTAVFLPGNGASRTYATAIADNGQIVGWSTLGVSEGLIWSSPTSSPVGIVPPGFAGAQILTTDGTTQGGTIPVDGGDHAAIWQGTNESFIDLSPSGYASADVRSVYGSQEVGEGDTSTTPAHALLWTGNNPNATDLNSAGFQDSVAEGTNGSKQVGFGETTINGQPSGYQALLWSGTAASAQNITPAGYADAQAWAISGNLVAGWADGEAALWDLSNGSFTDLGPGTAYAIAGNYEVGYRNVGPNHAMLWEGSAVSAIDLNNYLPSGYASIAYGVDAEGDVVGGASNGTGYYAVEWIAPEPSIFAWVISGVMFIVRRRRS